MREQAAILSRRALAALPIAALAGASPTASATLSATIEASANAMLLDLGWRWAAAVAAVIAHDQAWSTSLSKSAYAEHEAIVERLFQVEQDLYLSIVATPARTVQGLAVKAQVMAREFDEMGHGTEPIEAALSRAQDHETRIALSVALDILKLARAA